MMVKSCITYVHMYVVQFLCQFHFCIVIIEAFLSLKHTTHKRSHTALCAVGPTRLWCVNGHFVGIRPDSVLAPGSQLEGVG